MYSTAFWYTELLSPASETSSAGTALGAVLVTLDVLELELELNAAARAFLRSLRLDLLAASAAVMASCTS